MHIAETVAARLMHIMANRAVQETNQPRDTVHDETAQQILRFSPGGARTRLKCKRKQHGKTQGKSARKFARPIGMVPPRIYAARHRPRNTNLGKVFSSWISLATHPNRDWRGAPAKAGSFSGALLDDTVAASVLTV
jgi:hypothetical protein